jgi:hypothetical protein
LLRVIREKEIEKKKGLSEPASLVCLFVCAFALSLLCSALGSRCLGWMQSTVSLLLRAAELKLSPEIRLPGFGDWPLLFSFSSILSTVVVSL